MTERKHTCTKKLYEPQKFNNLKEIINNSQEKFADKPAFKLKTEQEGVFKEITYKEYKDDSEEVTSPDNDMNMSDDSFGVTKKKDNHVIPVLVVILLTVVMILLIVRYIQVRNQRKRRRRHRRR